ncbi:MAG TPA: response regulator [Rhodanobacteraceae bacterium]|nr:response regulator [Rhodanobacteraceae bacterium]
MANSNEALLKRLLATFGVEAEEHLTAMSGELRALSASAPGADRAALVETIFRRVHSLKGAARAVNLAPVESLCQALEGLFAALKAKRLEGTPALYALLQEAADALGQLVDESVAGARVRPAVALVRRLQEAARDAVEEPAAEAVAPAMPAAATKPIEPAAAEGPPDATARSDPGTGMTPSVRVASIRLDALTRQVEELLTPRQAVQQRAGELREALNLLGGLKRRRQAVRPAIRALERDPAAAAGPLAQLLAALDDEQLQLKRLEDRLAASTHAAEHDQRTLSALTSGLRQKTRDMQLLPFGSLLELLPRLARELAREQGKQVELSLRGGDIRIDRRILEALKDPLIHLLRNAIDHGIEPPAVRAAAGKPEAGALRLAVAQRDSGKVELLVADDGAGIDMERVRGAARKLGLLSPGMTQAGGDAPLELVFESGLSTSPMVTDLSGLGLGLAIVREAVERLGGALALDSNPGAGTTFRLRLPQTLANVRGILVGAGGRQWLLPVAQVEQVAQVPAAEVRTVENRETVVLDGQALALARLAEVLELPPPPAPPAPPDQLTVVVLGEAPARIAFLVDAVLGEQEVLVKPLGRQLARVRNIAGASVVGPGELVPVLNPADLLKSAPRHGRPLAAMTRAVQDAPAHVSRGSILVVEDSITSRSLLKNILEAAGYRVTTAVDGVDGYTILKMGAFDLVVSDVEMPRLDGFGLTRRIREDAQLAQLPVILVTALESREDRERGADAGASAYLVKSSFDQSNLLEAIRRLL